MWRFEMGKQALLHQGVSLRRKVTNEHPSATYSSLYIALSLRQVQKEDQGEKYWSCTLTRGKEG